MRKYIVHVDFKSSVYYEIKRFAHNKDPYSIIYIEDGKIVIATDDVDLFSVLKLKYA